MSKLFQQYKMSNRAIITGIGNKYEMTGGELMPLNADIDLSQISEMLSIKDWDSIDHIDDNDASYFDPATNNILKGEKLQPTKENILKTINDIVEIDPATSNLLFYFTGHGLKVGGLFMVTYDENYFNDMDIKHPPNSLLNDDSYINTINELLKKNELLKVITVIDCCFAGCMIASAKQANKFLNRHIIFCAVNALSAARGPDKVASFFTGNFCKAVKETTTYEELQNKLIAISGSFLPDILLPNTLHNKVHPF